MNNNVEKDKQRRSNLLLNLYKNNKFNEAINYSTSFMNDFPTDASGYNIYALSKKALGDIEDAKSFYEVLIRDQLYCIYIHIFCDRAFVQRSICLLWDFGVAMPCIIAVKSCLIPHVPSRKQKRREAIGPFVI